MTQEHHNFAVDACQSGEHVPPLCVDLDGTLIAGDTLLISVGLLLRKKPWMLPVAMTAVLRGRAYFKSWVARHVLPDPAKLPYRRGVVALLARERQAGRRVILATAANSKLAKQVADHLGLFSDVLASTAQSNIKGVAKLEAIRQFIGRDDFDYVGDSLADVAIFKHARIAYVVCPSAELRKATSDLPGIVEIDGETVP